MWLQNFNAKLKTIQNEIYKSLKYRNVYELNIQEYDISQI